EGIHPEDRPRVEENLERMNQGEEITVEFRVNEGEDFQRWVIVDGIPIENDEGTIVRHVGTVRDVTELKRTQRKLEEALKEKDTLLKEVHHRVKNNMQVISSMLRLQSNQIDVPEVNEKLENSLNRIQSMSMTHEMLYRSDQLDAIRFDEYTDELIDHLYRTYGDEVGELDFQLEVDDCEVDLDTAIPCGLLLTELFTNSLQHGFSTGESGTIKIEFFSENGEYTLAVSDNGRGFPEGFDPGDTDSLGFQLITALVEGNLRGELEIDRGEWTTVRVTFEGENVG
ncbi:MAG: sensor histidine kinase, partial [bacterium]